MIREEVEDTVDEGNGGAEVAKELGGGSDGSGGCPWNEENEV
jgi:hypothetical protein